MLRNSLLICGLILLILQEYIFDVSINHQFIIFIIGILILGIPHGAADILVAEQNSDYTKKVFSKTMFLIEYLTKLFTFACILWFFPIVGNLLFILFAAYHFGETDLHHFKTNTFLGKIFVVSYGILILSIILLHHFEDVIPLFLMFESGIENLTLINYIDVNRYSFMSISGIFFFTSAFVYFLKNRNTVVKPTGDFLVHFAIIIFILFKLPMLLGFTFYFVVWHSVLSLTNIVSYLIKENAYSKYVIVQQIIIYSLLAISGIVIFAISGFKFLDNSTLTSYLFLGLAVLTAPHLPVMHEMYINIRKSLSIK